MGRPRQLKGSNDEDYMRERPKIDGNPLKKAAKQTKPSLMKADSEDICQKPPEISVCLTEAANTVVTSKHDDCDVLDPSAKIKLQLFPVDEGTRIGLEQDGHNPYLELVLRPRKKMISVVKHLSSKWGTSKMAQGVLTLFPYKKESCTPSCVWKECVDVDVCAGNLFAAMGYPSAFRLRYGWVSDFDSEHFEAQPACKPVDAPGEILNKASNDKKETDSTCQELSLMEKREASESHRTTTISCGMQDEEEVTDMLPPDSPSRADAPAAVTVGGTPSVTSLQANPSGQTDKSHNSFDAMCVSENVDGTEESLPMTSHSSILDANETCHAFSAKLYPSSRRDLSHSVPSGLKIQNDDNSLGLTGIKWNDSLGPFDLGLCPSRWFTGGESISLTRFLK